MMTREEAAEKIREGINIAEFVESSYVGCILIEALKIALKALEESEPKTGKWTYGENKYGHDGWQCDQCGHWILWDYRVSMEDAERDLPKYCPNCGARMQEGEEP